jgi:hypothetical protein
MFRQSRWHLDPLRGTPVPRHVRSLSEALSERTVGGRAEPNRYIKAVTIMSLKDVLNEMENDSGERRNPGWRVEGHHVSQNYISHPLENATHNTIRSYDDCHEAR